MKFKDKNNYRTIICKWINNIGKGKLLKQIIRDKNDKALYVIKVIL